MKFTSGQSDNSALKEIGNRLAQYRLNQNKSQAELAQQAGVSNRTITRIENGHSAQTASLIRILRALQLTDNLEALVPEQVMSPVQQVKLQGKKRMRASSEKTRPSAGKTWSWGDEK